ncbi:MAG TPA: NUDIX domain-containing protein [Tepidisphaeraceae bacterium]|jgi:8-oxo-dGTP diphosphatase
MQLYVCGFLFSPDRSRVLLIRKNRPAWQVGRLNGIGGKVEKGETPHEAMRREFREEASVDLADWQKILVLTGSDWQGHFFRAFGPIDDARAATDEALEVPPVDPLPPDVIRNLRWIIPLMLDDDPHAGVYQVELAATEKVVGGLKDLRA